MSHMPSSHHDDISYLVENDQWEHHHHHHHHHHHRRHTAVAREDGGRGRRDDVEQLWLIGGMLRGGMRQPRSPSDHRQHCSYCGMEKYEKVTLCSRSSTSDHRQHYMIIIDLVQIPNKGKCIEVSWGMLHWGSFKTGVRKCFLRFSRREHSQGRSYKPALEKKYSTISLQSENILHL